MGPLGNIPLVIISVLLSVTAIIDACSNGGCKLLEECSSTADCAAGLLCGSCPTRFDEGRCIRSNFTDQFKLLDGVRALMLDTYDFEDDIWLCHSFEGECNDFTAFSPAIDTLKEVEVFLAANPSEIVTLILEDYVESPNGLTKVFNASGLMKYWFPVSNMPQNGQDWPLVKDMVANNRRLIVFTTERKKQESEGIAYQWNYMVENMYGDDGMNSGSCPNRAESATLNDKTKPLVLVNYYKSVPIMKSSCEDNSPELLNMLQTCYGAAGNRWANFVAVDFYKRSDGRGAFQAVDRLNGKLLCGCNDVNECTPGSLTTCNPLEPIHNSKMAVSALK
ncbi:hypothetical protein RGQ29_016067 [Quercus rubra]|uniref:PI-PLC X domain-containing protein n=1 Tax=Quercus rubra TaxID=3512 RepID=A0AAN7J595_QUERU|nr:hypothetical protein RGQ29_016067 [Quercus rubra]